VMKQHQQATDLRLVKEAEAAASVAALELTAEQRKLEQARAEFVRLDMERDSQKALMHSAAVTLATEMDAKARKHAEALQLTLLNETDRRARERDALLAVAQNASAHELELTRRETEQSLLSARLAHEATLSAQRIAAEMEARVREVRENEDVHARAAAAAAAAEQQRWQAVLVIALDRMAHAFHALLTQYIGRVALAVAAVAVAVFGSREAFTLMRSEAQRYFGTPALIRETSRPTGALALLLALLDKLTCGAASTLHAWRHRRARRERLRPGSPCDAFADTVLSPAVEAHIRRLSLATANAHDFQSPLRHVMLHGPPGTGKTMVAQKIARVCGLHYAMMSGGDVAPLGPAAVTEFNKLFEWAKCTPYGMLLFIDEAETFLGSRGGANVSENTRNVLSALLHHTGEQSHKLMLVLATNRPGDIDSAVRDRMDDMVHIPTPSPPQRIRIGRLYFYKLITARSQFAHVCDAQRPVPDSDARAALASARASARSMPACCRAQRRRIALADDVTLAVLDDVCRAAEGLSGRQLYKLVLSMQAHAFAQCAAADQDAVVTSALMRSALEAELQKLALDAAAVTRTIVPLQPA
ncbi:MAG: AAA family ATPase, partial [Methanobacteriota archaeon]